jgi:hypothetical protein
VQGAGGGGRRDAYRFDLTTIMAMYLLKPLPVSNGEKEELGERAGVAVDARGKGGRCGGRAKGTSAFER